MSHFATPSWGGRRKLPYAFTEHGILMLANVLKSERAIKMSILIIEVFVKIREMLLTHKDVLLRLEKIEQTITEHDSNIYEIFEYLKQLEQAKQEQLNQKNRKKIGFKIMKIRNIRCTAWSGSTVVSVQRLFCRGTGWNDIRCCVELFYLLKIKLINYK
ncbi:MAG: hypothetical protein IMY72_11295 [Bacteroidetes bacterium]|nr:hypothetical protein [Bacteroidota bacterium]